MYLHRMHISSILVRLLASDVLGTAGLLLPLMLVVPFKVLEIA